MRISRNLLVFFSVFIVSTCHTQSEDIFLKVLVKDKVNKLYVFDSSNKKDGVYKILVTYLGNINTLDKVYKIITCKIIWGSNQHTSGSVYIYNNQNEFVGVYYLGSGFAIEIQTELGE